MQKLKRTKNGYIALIAALLLVVSGIGIAMLQTGAFSVKPSSQEQTVTPTEEPTTSPSPEEVSPDLVSTENTSPAEPAKEEAPAEAAPSEEPAPAVEEPGNTSSDAAPAPAPAAPVAPAAPAPAPVAPVAPVAPPVTVPVPVPVAPAPAAPVDSEYAQLVRSIVAPWCGYVNVLVDDPSVVSGDIYGMSWWGTNKIGIRSGIPMAITKDMALHECGHILQARVFPNKQDAVNRLNALHGTTYAIETNARCISAYLHPNALPAGVGSGATARWHSAECAGVAGEAAIKIVQGVRP